MRSQSHLFLLHLNSKWNHNTLSQLYVSCLNLFLSSDTVHAIMLSYQYNSWHLNSMGLKLIGRTTIRYTNQLWKFVCGCPAFGICLLLWLSFLICLHLTFLVPYKMECTAPGICRLKLGDFGLAMVVTEAVFTICGTPTYVAPEILCETG